jgi:hypothetical protein
MATLTQTQTEFIGKNNTGIESYCISIAFYRPTLTRSGAPTNDVLINNIPVEAGRTFTIAQNVGDLDTTRYEANFISVAGGENELYVIRIVPQVKEGK